MSAVRTVANKPLLPSFEITEEETKQSRDLPTCFRIDLTARNAFIYQSPFVYEVPIRVIKKGNGEVSLLCIPRGEPTPEQFAEQINRYNPNSDIFNPIAYHNAVMIEKVYKGLLGKQEIPSSETEQKEKASSVSPEKQMGILRKMMSTWKDFEGSHEGISIEALSFLSLEKFIILSSLQLFIEIQKFKKGPKYPAVAQSFIDSIVNRLWQTKGLTELFTNLINSVELEISKKTSCEYHVKMLRIVSGFSDCLQMTIGENQKTIDSISRKPAFDYASNLAKKLYTAISSFKANAEEELHKYFLHIRHKNEKVLQVIKTTSKDDKILLNGARNLVRFNKMCLIWLNFFQSMEWREKILDDKVRTLAFKDNPSVLKLGAEYSKSVSLCMNDLHKLNLGFGNYFSIFKLATPYGPGADQFVACYEADRSNSYAMFYYEVMFEIEKIYEKFRTSNILKDRDLTASSKDYTEKESLSLIQNTLTLLILSFKIKKAKLEGKSHKRLLTEFEQLSVTVREKKSKNILLFIDSFFNYVEHSYGNMLNRSSILTRSLGDLYNNPTPRENEQELAKLIDLIIASFSEAYKQANTSKIQGGNLLIALIYSLSSIFSCIGGQNEVRSGDVLTCTHRKDDLISLRRNFPDHVLISKISDVARTTAILDPVLIIRDVNQLIFETLFPIIETCSQGPKDELKPLSEDDWWLTDIDKESEQSSFIPDPFLEIDETDAKEASDKVHSQKTSIPIPDKIKQTKPSLTSLEHNQIFSEIIYAITESYGMFKDIMPPTIMQGYQLPAEDHAKHQQIHALHCLQLLSNMLHNSEGNAIQETLASQFLLWGHQSIEQGLTARLLHSDPKADLAHPLNILLERVRQSGAEQWINVANRATLFARYPHSFIQEHPLASNPLALRLCVVRGEIRAELAEFDKIFDDLLQEALVTQIEASPGTQSFIEVALKALKSSKMSPINPIVKDELCMSEEQLKQLTMEKEKIIKAIGELQIKIKALIDREGNSKKIQRLKNVCYHLEMLSRVPAMLKLFPQPKFWLIPGQLALLSAQYAAENLGAYLALKEGVNLSTHNLMIYRTVYRLGFFLNERELHQLDWLDVKKGSEYPWKYFAQTPKGSGSPLMHHISDLAFLSKTLVCCGEDFIPRDSKNLNAKAIKNQLVEDFLLLSQLSLKLIKGHTNSL